MEIFLIGLIAMFVLAILCKPVRKAVGLVLVISGIISCFSIIFLVPGLISIFLGGIFLFS